MQCIGPFARFLLIYLLSGYELFNIPCIINNTEYSTTPGTQKTNILACQRNESICNILCFCHCRFCVGFLCRSIIINCLFYTFIWGKMELWGNRKCLKIRRLEIYTVFRNLFLEITKNLKINYLTKWPLIY